ncbi:unnamed protein product [Allacma fusca]|uniref:ODAD1 central coiled coil region domain-containing protein n=1 Tax=Allacma fusca TaxID=39272 RepID=A0A8J2LNU6_9HEXA|nr:unnamed protein product [Allacma fusca]
MVGRKQDTQGNEPEDNTEVLAKEECSRLARQLRLMENDKKAYLDESTSAINQQKKSIGVLEKENAKMEAELANFRNKYNEERDEENIRRIHAIVDNYKEMKDTVSQQAKIIAEIEKKLDTTFSRVEKLRMKVNANQNEALPLPELEQKIFVLSKKLETVTSQFDAVVADNCELRQTIDETLKENSSIMIKYNQLDCQVAKGKANIDELVDHATSAYDQREEAIAKANALKERNAKEKKQYNLETSELSRIIRHEEKLLDFMSTKNKERTFLETEEQRLSRLELAKEYILEEALERYRQNFEKLLTEETTNILALVDEYSELQHNNISRFNYINELNNEIEALQSDVTALRESIKKCSSETIERNQAKNAAIMKQLGELEGLKSDYRHVRLQLDTSKTSMDEIVSLIDRLFQITDCNDAAPVLELLGNQQEISTQNAILYLNILEHRIAEIFTYKREPDSGRVTPAMRSPRPISKSLSDVSLNLRPRIIVSERTDSKDDAVSEDELQYNLVETEQNPLTYSIMRDKILDAASLGSKTPSSMSGDDPKLANI